MVVGAVDRPTARNPPLGAMVILERPWLKPAVPGPNFKLVCVFKLLPAAMIAKFQRSVETGEPGTVKVRLNCALAAGIGNAVWLPLNAVTISVPDTEPSTCQAPERYSKAMSWDTALVVTWTTLIDPP